MTKSIPPALTPQRLRQTSTTSRTRAPGAATPAAEITADVAVEAPAAFERAKPTARRAPTPEVDDQALAEHLGAQPWFDDGGKPVRELQVLSSETVDVADPGARHVLAQVQVRFEDGTKERYLAPLRIDGQGKITDALASPAFKDALVARVAQGEQFEPRAASAAATRPRRKSAPPSGGAGWLGASLRDKLDSGKASAPAGNDPKLAAAALARAVYDKDTSAKNPFRALIDKGYTTPERYEHVLDQVKKLSPNNADALVVAFFQQVAKTLDAQPQAVKDFQAALATKPKFGPVFYGYAQFMGVQEGKASATFDDLIPFLDVIQGPQGQASALGSMARAQPDADKPAGLGFRGLELLPFFLSPQKDGGYDITDHKEVDPALGGSEAYGRFMQSVVDRGMRVTADIVANHVGDEHAWVKALQNGDSSMLQRFVVWDDALKIGERKVDDKMFNVFLHTKGEHAGKVSHVWQIFPDNNPDTMIDATVGEQKHKLFASFVGSPGTELEFAL